MPLPRSISRRRHLALVLLAVLPAARAADVPKADARAIRQVIEAQLAAFAADDAARAFSFATPQLREHFGSPERFMAMVQASYPVVYRPASVAFLAPEAAPAEVLQGVQLSDQDGRVFVATYHLVRQPDGHWRISGCELRQGQGRSV